MGLDFNHSKAHWSFSGFNEFRRRLANEIGMTLDDMEYFGGSLKWDKVNDPIVSLLKHSDCDGFLTPLECKSIAPRLRKMVEGWPEKYNFIGSYDKEHAILLAEGMEYCSKNNKSLYFHG